MRAWLVSLAFLATPVAGWADFSAAKGPVSPDIIALEAGIICPPETVGSAPAPGTVAGTTHIIDVEPPFVSNARRVPAVLGIGFGVKSQTSIEGGLDGVTMVVTHPPMGGSGAEAQSFVTRVSELNPSLTFYQFDYSYELLPGTWKMTAMRDDAVLFQVAFDVVPPSAVPELAQICGYLDLLS
jgi:hypothetical protein